MRIVRPISKEELDTFITITVNAYPGIDAFDKSERSLLRDRLQRASEDPLLHLHALFEDGEMCGVMRLYDFTMKLLSTRALVGGVGGLAVDLMHKKKKIAADMILAYLQHYQEKGACLAALYPFRPDFYKRMGFGYGTKMNSYCFKPDSLPKAHIEREVIALSDKDKSSLLDCYDRFLERSNGLMERHEDGWEMIFADPTFHVVGVRRARQLGAYMIYKFTKGRRDHFLSNDILIYELVYDTAADLTQLLQFLRNQADQIERIIINTQDEAFHYLLADPRYGSGKMLPQVLYHESNTQGLGIMYRVINIPQLFQTLQNHNFGDVTCRLRIDLTDTFMPQNSGSYVVQFDEGQPHLSPGKVHDVAIQLDVAEFSSLVVGSIGFQKLYDYGLASISDSGYVKTINRLFEAQKPICMTRF